MILLVKLCFYGGAMKGEKVDCLFYSVSNSHVDFCSFLENRAISFLVKTRFDETDFFDEIKIIFVDFSFLCAFDFPIIAKIRKKFCSHFLTIFGKFYPLDFSRLRCFDLTLHRFENFYRL